MVNQQLVNFIKKALARGLSEDYIRRGLLAKGWPIIDLNTAFDIVRVEHFQEPSERISLEEVEKSFSAPKEKEQIREAKKEGIPFILIFKTFLIFLGLVVLTSATFSVYYFMEGKQGYVFVPEGKNELVRGKCINEDCSDMTEFAIKHVKGKLWFSLVAGAIIAAIIIFLYHIVPNKKLMVWIFNIIYLLVLAYMAIRWINFQRGLA